MGSCQTASSSQKKQPAAQGGLGQLAAQGGPHKVSTSDDIEDEFGYIRNPIEQGHIKDELARRGIRRPGDSARRLWGFFLGASSDSYSRRDEPATLSGRRPTNPPQWRRRRPLCRAI